MAQQHLTKFAFLTVFIVLTVITPSNQFAGGRNDQSKTTTETEDTVTYIRASIPLQIFECTRKLNLLRCMKLFLLQRMAEIRPGRVYPNSGNLTKDFLEQILGDDQNYPTLLDTKYMKIGDKDLTAMIVESFQNFFKNREIKLHFIPGVMVRVVPSKENKIRLSLKRGESMARKHKTYKHMMQIAVPVMVMPAVILGSFLPFILPALKMATIMATVVNNGALIAALIYAAKTATAANNEQMIQYAHPGFH